MLSPSVLSTAVLKFIVPPSIANSLYLLKVFPPSVPAVIFTPNLVFIPLKSVIFAVPKLVAFIATTSLEYTLTFVFVVVIGLLLAGRLKSISINVELPLNSMLLFVKFIFPFPSE